MEFWKKHWFEICLSVVVIAVHLYAAASDAHNLPSQWFNRDDAYYYFKVAQNITEGKGITFDGINLTNGYHPLWMLVNIPIFTLARFDLILPLRTLILLQGVFSAATAILIYRIARGAISEPVAVLGASWWAFDAYIHGIMYEFGLETGLAAFTTALLVYRLFIFEGRWRKANPRLNEIFSIALMALLVLLSRLDLVFLAILSGTWIIFRGSPLRFLLPLDMLLAAVAAFAGFTLRLGLPDYYNYAGPAMVMAAISVLSKLVLYFLAGLYQPVAQKLPLQTAMRIVWTVSLSTLVTGLVMFIGTGILGSFPRTALIYDWMINIMGMLVLRGLWCLFTRGTNTGSRSPLELLRANWPTWFREGQVFYGTIGVPLALYMLANKLMIGTFMPVSGQIKRWWGEAGSRAYGGSARSFLSFWGADFETDFNAWQPFSGGLARLGLRVSDLLGGYRNENIYGGLLLFVCLLWVGILLLNRRKAVRATTLAGLPLLFTASMIQVLSYNAQGYSAMKEWYWISQPLFIVLALGLAVWILLNKIYRLQAARAALWAIVLGVSLWMALGFADLTVRRMPYGSEKAGTPYMDSVAFLEENTPPGSIIGMTGGGNVGYYIKDRIIINMDGLINSPAYFEALKARQADRYLQQIGVDYIFANPTILEQTPYFDQFPTGNEIGRFGGKWLVEFTP